MKIEKKSVIILPIFFLLIILIFVYLNYEIKNIEQNKTRIEIEKDAFPKVKRTMRITGYAPLDPKAVKGMCYSGDPKITASGKATKPNITIAADKNIPFGTRVFIPMLGWRVVEDRGGRINKNRLDICFKTKEEAINWGVKNLEVYLIFPVEGDL